MRLLKKANTKVAITSEVPTIRTIAIHCYHLRSLAGDQIRAGKIGQGVSGRIPQIMIDTFPVLGQSW